ncbi:tetratricopeptide repeat protein [Campylobacter concisus]
MKKSILFLAFALLSLNANWDINMQECINKSNTKACENFTKKLSSECENKDKISCFIYADIIGRGLGAEKDTQKSFEIFKSLCDDGSSEACYELATKYLQGNGTEQSFDLSENALDKACKMGSKRACNVLELVPKN